MRQILKDRLLVERVKVEKTSILDIVEDESGPVRGTVLLKGSQVSEINVNDGVIFNELDAQTINLDGKNFFILREYDIIGII